MDEEVVVHTHNGILVTKNNAICSNVDATRDHRICKVSQKEKDKRMNILYVEF